jgi:hypothetical protein
VLYALLMLHKYQLDHQELILTMVATTVLVSIFAHGLSASPAAGVYGQAMAGLRDTAPTDAPDPPELLAVHEMPLRLRHKGREQNRPEKDAP